MNWLSLLGIEDTLARLRTLMNEGAIAAEDRMELLSIEWRAQKKQLIALSLVGLVTAGLTIVALTIVSAAIVISYWDTPQRVHAAWIVAAVWGALWLGALIYLFNTVKKATSPFGLTKSVFLKDWAAVRRRLK